MQLLTRMTPKKRTKEAGITLFEMLAYVFVLGLAAAIITPLINNAINRGVNVSLERSAMASAINNIDDHFNRDFIDNTFDNQEALDSQLIPEAYKFVNGSDTITNIFGKDVTITGVDLNGLIWASEGVTEAACSKLVQTTSDLGFETVDVGGNAITYVGVAPSTPAEITAACVAGLAGTDEVTVTWTRAPN